MTIRTDRRALKQRALRLHRDGRAGVRIDCRADARPALEARPAGAWRFVRARFEPPAKQ